MTVAASHPLERSEDQPAKQAERGDDYCAALNLEVEVEVEVGPPQPHPSLSTPIVNVNKCLLVNTKLTDYCLHFQNLYSLKV